MTKSWICVFGLIAVLFGVASAITEDEIKSWRAAAYPIIEACGQEYGVTKEQVVAAKETGDVDTFDHCFYACFFKKTGVIDENGLFDPNVAIEKNKKYIKSEDYIAKMVKIGEICTSVNDQTVSDGDKGCERSKLLFSCFHKEKSNFSLFESV